MGRRGWWGVLGVGVEEGGRKTERRRCCGRIHMFSSQGPLPHKTLYTIPIYRSSEQQQCCSHSLCWWLSPSLSLSLSLSPFDCMSLSPSLPRSLLSLGYLIIRQFLAVATYCSGVLGLPDYRVSLKSPKVCVLRVCASVWVSVTLYLASKNGRLDYTVNLWVIIGLQFCSDSSSPE